MPRKQPLSTLPISKAKTAYGLLSEVATVALDEPQRIAMGVWRRVGVPGGYTFVNQHTIRFPACGTVGCIAGWVAQLKNMDDTQTAGPILGLDTKQENDLFMARALCRDPKQQTLAHAKKVVAHIRKFQKRYRQQLLAKKV